ncbi:hypothetical protein SAMN04489764_4624 [Thermostaphylospora chromogena]|uniref:DUF2231 domain-containing protein n=1 Tax=Thermostaphylospora chromogena TaxID=35622 RepID=A0A1H1HN77_9ACTN|nr:hypothetical protein SAMN04489764_4624 [Thermostaphylospora chromogena]
MRWSSPYVGRRPLFEEILGLPAHPLIIHAAVVFTPLAAVLSLVYAVVPRWRARISWAVAASAVIAPLSVLAARQSGLALEERLYHGRLPEGEFGQKIMEHSGFANPLLFSTAGMGVAALALVFGAERLGKVPAAVLSGVTVVLALVAGFYVFRAGHSGAEAVWSF